MMTGVVIEIRPHVEIQVKEGGSSLHMTFRKINLVFKGLTLLIIFIASRAN